MQKGSSDMLFRNDNILSNTLQRKCLLFEKWQLKAASKKEVGRRTRRGAGVHIIWNLKLQSSQWKFSNIFSFKGQNFAM